MADNRGYASSKFVPTSSDELTWHLTQARSQITVNVDASRSIVVLTAGPSGGGSDAFLPIRKGKLLEAQQIAATLVSACSIGFAPSQGLARALLDLLDPVH